MSLRTLQVTIGAGVTQASATSIPVRQVIIQNNAAHKVIVGDSNVSASRGIVLQVGGGSVEGGALNCSSCDLNEIWLAGTQNDVIDFLYWI